MSVARYLIPALLVPSMVFTPGFAAADTKQGRARVVNVKPTYETVTYTVPVEQCHIAQVPVDYGYEFDEYPARYERPRSRTAPIVGAIIGGAVGHAVGHGKTNRRVTTAVGAVLGASIGADVARKRASVSDRYRARRVSYRDEEVCEVVNEYREEQRVTGYRVKYRYAGETYVTMMDHDPGRHLRVRVEVTPVS